MSADLWYFIRRYLKSVSFFILKRKQGKHDKNYSHEGDFGKMEFSLSGRVEITFKDGKTISETCNLPPGFANDPEREEVIQNKFLREATPVWGEDKSKRIMDLILNIEKYSCSTI